LKIDSQRFLFIATLLILSYLVIPPLFFTVKASLYYTKGFEKGVLSLKYYKDIFSTPGTAVMLRNTLVFAIGSSAMSIIIGTLLAWLVERTNTPFKTLAYLSAFANFAIPGILKVIGWILLLGPEAGLLNVWIKDILHLESSPFNIFSMPGMILIEAIVWTPVVFLFMAAPFRAMDPSLEESANMSGAGIGKTFYHITIRLALPSVLSVLLLNFIRALEAFEIPALVGLPSGIMVLTSEIYLKIQSGLIPQYGLASAYAIALISFVLGGLYLYGRVTRQAQKFYTITGKGFRPRPIDIGRWRYPATVLVCLLPAIQLLPVLVLLYASLLPYYAKPSLQIFAGLTLSNYLKVFQNPLALDALKNSLFIGLISATACILLAAVVAWLVIRTTIRWRNLLDHMASFTLVFPGVVLGVALLVTYLTLPIPLYGTIWVLVIAFITAYIPYGMRFCYPGLLQINKELEESAQMSGATWSKVFRKIIVPLMMPSLFAGFIYIFLHSVRGLSLPILLSRPGTEVISVLIFDMWENGQTTEIGAYGIALTVILVAIAMGFRKLSIRYGLQQKE